MKKSLKNILLGALLLPASMLCVACDETPDDTGVPKTQAEINTAGYNLLKNVSFDYDDYAGSKTVARVESYENKNRMYIGNEEIYSKGFPSTSSDKRVIKTTFDASTNTGASRVYSYDNNTLGNPRTLTAIEKDGEDFVKYYKDYHGSNNVSYVGEDYVEKMLYSNEVSSIIQVPDIDLSCVSQATNFEDMLVKIENSVNEDYADNLYKLIGGEVPDIDVTGKMVQTFGGYALNLTGTASDIDTVINGMHEATATLTMTAEIYFSASGMEGTIVDIVLSGVSEIGDSTKITSQMTLSSEATYINGADSQLLLSSAEKLEFGLGTINPASIRVNAIATLDGEEFTRTLSKSFGDAISLSDLSSIVATSGTTIEKWYIDKAKTIEYDFSTPLPSYDITLYADATFSDNNAACVREAIYFRDSNGDIEKYSLGSRVITASDGVAIHDLDGLKSVLNYYSYLVNQIYEIRVNGVAISDMNVESITIEAGKFYEIEYICYPLDYFTTK